MTNSTEPPAATVVGGPGMAKSGLLLVIDETEMAEINWYTRDEVASALAGSGPFVAPPPHAIAHHLLHWWVSR